MKFRRMPIEKESPEEFGYGNIECNLSESSVRDAVLGDLEIRLQDLGLAYIEHRGDRRLREVIAAQYAGSERGRRPGHAGRGGGPVHAARVLLERTITSWSSTRTTGRTWRRRGPSAAALEALPLAFEDGFQPDLDRLRGMVSARTKLISVTNPHNPTGVLKPEAVVRGLLEIASGCGGAAAGGRDLPRRLRGGQAAAGRGPGPARRLRLLDVQGLRPARASASAGS